MPPAVPASPPLRAVPRPRRTGPYDGEAPGTSRRATGASWTGALHPAPRGPTAAAPPAVPPCPTHPRRWPSTARSAARGGPVPGRGSGLSAVRGRSSCCRRPAVGARDGHADLRPARCANSPARRARQEPDQPREHPRVRASRASGCAGPAGPWTPTPTATGSTLAGPRMGGWSAKPLPAVRVRSERPLRRQPGAPPGAQPPHPCPRTRGRGSPGQAPWQPAPQEPQLPDAEPQPSRPGAGDVAPTATRRA